MPDYFGEGHRNLIGGDNANNSTSTSAVTANADGSVLERLEHLLQTMERNASTTTAAVMVTGTTIFTVAGAPILITELVSHCVTVCDGTASTLQWSADGTVGGAVTFTAASASLASFAAGGFVACNFTALSTAPDLTVASVGLASVKTRGVIVMPGIITTTIGVGSTTGTFNHYMRYQPLGLGVTVTPAF